MKYTGCYNTGLLDVKFMLAPDTVGEFIVAQVSYLAIVFSAIGQDRILGYIVGSQFRQQYRPPEKNALDIENVSNYTVEIGDGVQVSMAVQVKKYLTFFSIKCIMGD
jgi:hypothetical protein